MSSEVVLADLQISSQSKQYVRVPVTASSDPTHDAVAWAIVPPGEEPTVFVTGDWQTIGSTFYARVPVGPGTSLVLARGYYELFVQISDTPETPVLRAGVLEVTY